VHLGPTQIPLEEGEDNWDWDHSGGIMADLVQRGDNFVGNAGTWAGSDEWRAGISERGAGINNFGEK